MIKTQALTMTYQNGYTAVKGIDLDVEKSDIFGFLGPNGAGKTTTIRMLTGLLKPTSGSIEIAGINVLKHPNEVKKIAGVLPESHGFYNSMVSVEYLNYFSDLYGMDKKSSKPYINDLLDKVGLSDKKDVIIGHYSRGMKQ
ncbi:MAG: ABC transporter ATP-binding protein, partial [Eubacteriales bacterium]